MVKASPLPLLAESKSCLVCLHAHVNTAGEMQGCRNFPCTGISPVHFDRVINHFASPDGALAAICNTYTPHMGLVEAAASCEG
jgi:hypothetical protein